MNQLSSQRPLVSVLLATFNEAKYIRATISSILRQQCEEFDLELLVLDGKSTDNTVELVSNLAAQDQRVRLLINPMRSTPAAFNIGLREARGEFVCIFGAHTRYADDYIAVCLREVTKGDVVGCGGRVITQPANQSLQACLVAWALAHPFGTSPKSFRTQSPGLVDIVNYPVIFKQALVEVGGYDETLVRNEDNDILQKLRARGGKLLCTWNTECFYYPVPDLGGLIKYAFRNGVWNAISFKKNSSSMTFRYFVPFLFVVTLLCLPVLGLSSWVTLRPHVLLPFVLWTLIVVVHLCIGAAASIQLAARHRCAAALWLPGVFFALHFAYGAGTLYAFLTNAKPASAY
jgi:glycosyltransferase involved in cell wall biosynthesis